MCYVVCNSFSCLMVALVHFLTYFVHFYIKVICQQHIANLNTFKFIVAILKKLE